MAPPRARADETLLEAYFERSSDGALVVNRLRKIVALNPAATTITGWQERDLASISCRAFSCRDERGRSTCQDTCLAQRCIENGQVEGPRYLRISRAGGGTVTVEATFVPLQPQDRRTGACLMMLRDISLLEHLDASLREREEEIAEKNMVLRSLAQQLSLGWRAALVDLRGGVDQLMARHAPSLGDAGLVTATRVLQGVQRVESTFAQVKAQLQVALQPR